MKKFLTAGSTATSLEAIGLRSGRQIELRKVAFGDGGFALEIAFSGGNGVTTSVRLPPRCFDALRRALDAIDASAQLQDGAKSDAVPGDLITNGQTEPY